MALEKIGHYSLTNPATIYDEEAMTALELAGRTAGKVNEAVEAFNEHERKTENRLKAQDNAIPVEVMKEVDKRIKDGSVNDAISEHLDNLNERLETLLGGMTEGSTTLDAEVIDLRTGADGQTKANAGTSTRNQFNKVKDGYVHFMTSKNLFTERDAVYGKYLAFADNKVTLNDNEKYATTDYLVIDRTDYLWLSLGIRFVMCYDPNYYPITGGFFAKETNTTNRITPPANTQYIRVTFEPNNVIAPNSNLFAVNTGFVRYAYAPRRNYVPAEHLPDGIQIGEVAPADLGIMDTTNKLNPKTINEGMYMGLDGWCYESDEYFHTDFIAVKENETVHFTPNARFVTAFDADFNPIKSAGAENYVKYVVPSGVAYIVVTLPIATKDSAMINVGAVRLPYVPYHHKIDRKYLDFNPDAVEGGSPQSESLVGGNAKRELYEGTVSSVAVSDYPQYIKKNNRMSVYIPFSGTYNFVCVGFGSTSYGSGYLNIANDDVTAVFYTDGVTKNLPVVHNLNISEFLAITLTMLSDQDVMRFTMITKEGQFTHDFATPHKWCGLPQVNYMSEEQAHDVVINATCADFSSPIWCIGDSYSNFDEERVFGALKAMGFTNYYLASLSGGSSVTMYEDLLKALNYGTPKYLLWLCGMNDDEIGHSIYVNQIIELCKEKGITPIFVVPPTIPNRDHSGKLAFLQSLGVRMIRWDLAVGSNSYGEWDNDYLSGDDVHPSATGAKALALRMLIDVPELMSY